MIFWRDIEERGRAERVIWLLEWMLVLTIIGAIIAALILSTL